MRSQLLGRDSSVVALVTNYHPKTVVKKCQKLRCDITVESKSQIFQIFQALRLEYVRSRFSKLIRRGFQLWYSIWQMEYHKFEFLRLRLWFLIFKAWLLLSRLRTQRCTSSRLEPRTQCFRGTRSHCSVLQCVAVHIASEKWGRGSLPKGQVERQRATWCIHTSKITHAHARHDSCTRSHTKHYSTRVYSLRTDLLGPHAILHIH